MAGIIKRDEIARGQAQAPAGVHWVDMAEAIQRRRQEAELQARRIIEQAERQAEDIRRHAEAQGLADATAKAEQTARRHLDERLKTLLPALQQAEKQLVQLRDQWIRHWEQHLVTLACAIAAKLIRRQVQHHPEIALQLVRESLEMASGWNPVTIELNPEDLATLGPQMELLARQWSQTVQVHFEANPQVERGSCRVVGKWGEIDQTWRAQLERVEKELLE
ncbi:MAG: hypothetical protein KatS3mg109_0998 [Pirellulaceae bacterium]|nr:MAG: hypothetical protein KatS3mg109_0998 [Pirellulaceae bacterium]GIW95076.1 MAG: hypothetical protein KatS3mg110_3117 [Pirellulaceae bacterium]